MCKCDITGCCNAAVADIQWGTDKLKFERSGEVYSVLYQVAPLCQIHLDELWEKINPLVKAYKAWVRLDLPGTINLDDPNRIMRLNDRIRLEAYALWEKSGKPIGEDQYFWFEAERRFL